MIEPGIGQTGCSGDHITRSGKDDANGNGMSDIVEGERGRGCFAVLFTRATQRFKDVQTRLPEPHIAEIARQRGYCRTVADEHDRTAVRRDMLAESRKRRGMKAEARGVLDRPAEPRGGKTECGGRRVRDPFLGRQVTGHRRPRAKPERITGHEHRDALPTMRQQAGNAVVERHWPGFDRTLKVGQQREMACGAGHEIGLRQRRFRRGGQSIRTVFAQSDNRQPGSVSHVEHPGTGRHDRG